MELIFEIITAIGSVATAVMVGILWKSFNNQKQQTKHLGNQVLVSNFSTLTNYTGNEKTRMARRVLYNNYKSKFVDSVLEHYPKLTDDEDLMNEWAKYVGAIYNRVGFLLQQDKKLKDKIIEYHGFTIGLIWKIFEPFNRIWIEKDNSKPYNEFSCLGSVCYFKWKELIDTNLEEKKKRNQNNDKLQISKEIIKSPLKW